jgi:hypothetical protein
MSETVNRQNREVEEATEFARTAAAAIKGNPQPVDSNGFESPYIIGDVEVFLFNAGDKSEIFISYNRRQLTIYNISSSGIKKTGFIEQGGVDDKSVKYYDNDPEAIRKLKMVGREVAASSAVVPAEKALIAKLVKRPMSRKICSDLRQYAMWTS